MGEYFKTGVSLLLCGIVLACSSAPEGKSGSGTIVHNPETTHTKIEFAASPVSNSNDNSSAFSASACLVELVAISPDPSVSVVLHMNRNSGDAQVELANGAAWPEMNIPIGFNLKSIQATVQGGYPLYCHNMMRSSNHRLIPAALRVINVFGTFFDEEYYRTLLFEATEPFMILPETKVLIRNDQMLDRMRRMQSSDEFDNLAQLIGTAEPARR